MGAWGAGIFQNDYAMDLKEAVSLVSKVPDEGEYLLGILKRMYVESTESDNEDWTTFWIVVADQFERRGLLSKELVATTIEIIKSGEDIRRLKELDMSKSELKKREKMLGLLAERLSFPRKTKARIKPKKPPSFCAEIGDVFSFPVCGFESMNTWFSSWEEAEFVPDGWGAFVVIGQGRAFDWLPWIAIASTNVSREIEPTLEDVLNANLVFHPQTNGAAKCVPKASHFKRMSAQLIGHLSMNSEKASAMISTWSEMKAINYGWSIGAAAINPKNNGRYEAGPVSSLLEK